MKTTYKIITKLPYDKDAPFSYWIKKENTYFNLFKTSSLIGKYKYDDTYGELDWCPFFDRKDAEEYLKVLNE